MAEGRSEYATQFFQHLIDHYAETPEAASARDALARLKGKPIAPPPPAPPSAANGQHLNGHNGHTRSPENGAANGGTSPALTRPRPVPPQSSPPKPPAAQQELGENGRPSLRLDVNGRGSPFTQAPADTRPGRPQLRPVQALRSDPGLDVRQPVSPRPSEQPPVAEPREEEKSESEFPPTERNYIAGRVISGLLAVLGIVGIFAGIILLSIVFSDPKLFRHIGNLSSVQAVWFSLSMFVGSLVMLVVSQIASAIFDGADAIRDLARIERFKAGDPGDEYE